MPQCPHVVQAVGQLDQDHPHIVIHRQECFAQILGFPVAGFAFRLVFRRGEGQLIHLGNATDQPGDFLAKLVAQILKGDRRVFDDVMEQPGGNHRRVQPKLDQAAGDCDAVNDIIFA